MKSDWINVYVGLSFPLQYENVNPGLERNRDGKNSLFITHGTFMIPHSWLSSCDKIKIPHLPLCCAWGIFISSCLLSHSWGIWNVPFVIRKEFFFPVFVASPLIQEKSHPSFSPDRDWLNPYRYFRILFIRIDQSLWTFNELFYKDWVILIN